MYDLSDDVLLELGRLTWAAINLEDAVYSICNAADPVPGFPDTTPLSDRINGAQYVLADRTDSPIAQAAAQWLAAARDALAARHAVLHAMPEPVLPD